jgi:hypothetical protein
VIAYADRARQHAPKTLEETRAAAHRLHLISVKELADGLAPWKRASMELDDYAARLRSMSQVLRPIQYGVALGWISDWRMYTFEKNTRRWPDGKFYLLNRSYQFWRGHRIAFDREELTALGCDEWDRRVIRCAHGMTCLPMEADCFHHAPRRQLKSYVDLVARLADAVAARAGSAA